MGYGWYCISSGNPATKDIDHGKSVKYEPDHYKVANKKYSYLDSCIHLNCNDGVGYDNDNNMWRCCSDFNCP